MSWHRYLPKAALKWILEHSGEGWGGVSMAQWEFFLIKVTFGPSIKGKKSKLVGRTIGC